MAKRDVFVMPFGRHKSKRISSIPKQYLRWLCKNVKLAGQLKKEVEQELEKILNK